MHRLLNPNLINRAKTGDRFTMLPLTRAFAVDKWADNPAWEHEARRHWVATYQPLAAQGVNPDNYPLLRPEACNLLEVMDWLGAQEKLAELSQFLGQVQDFLHTDGYWEQLSRLGDLVARWTKSNSGRNESA